MESNRMKREKSFDNLGLPPMELAESSSNEHYGTRTCTVSCISSTFSKIAGTVVMLIFLIGTFTLLLKALETNDTSISNREYFLIADFEDSSNKTIENKNVELLVLLNNTYLDKKRKKRQVTGTLDTIENALNIYSPAEHKILRRYGIKCETAVEINTCNEVLAKLKLIARNDIAQVEHVLENSLKELRKRRKRVDETNSIPMKRHAHYLNRLHDTSDDVSQRDVESRESYMYTYVNPMNAIRHPQRTTGQSITDTCLLARLLKHNYPHVHGIYDVPVGDYDHYDHRTLQTRHHPQSYVQSRDLEQNSKIHPQDVDIFMSFLTPKPETSLPNNALNSSKKDVGCHAGSLPCEDGESCIPEIKWCDGTVDCNDVSDELKCSCKSRVDKARLCDGYFDCPFGEDEMGCFGCDQNSFSCGDSTPSHSKCFSKEQRCNNFIDCHNHRDEADCNMLAPSLTEKRLFAISNTEGYLHRNFKGDWYSVCKNPYMWAHDVCRREAGLIIRPPYIQLIPIDPLLKVNYLNTAPGGSIQTSEGCYNFSAVYVTCPDLLCGTRVSTTVQSLRENPLIENQFYERSKRFSRNYYPYAFLGYRINYDPHKFNNENYTKNHLSNKNIVRVKRTESRVVGGKPSLPAAWPWMVAIYRDGMFHCGGVVVTQNWIISAAHCAHKFWDHYYEVQAGMLRRFSFSPQEQNHRVTHVISNQQYSQQDMKNDLSLLRVAPVIQFSRWVRPICLPSPDTAGEDWLWGPLPGTICTAVGWGATVEHGPDPDHMREVEVPVWESCKHREDRAGKEICAGFIEGGKDACQGDSGGPLLCKNPLNPQQWYIAGIVSHGDGCARKDEPGVYTRVSLFVKWIRYHMGSKTLPIVQPIQECPGFQCKSGMKKCLPNKRRCDKIIDCLDGEDEIGCIFLRSVNDNGDLILTTTTVLTDNNDNNNSSRTSLNDDEVTMSTVRESKLQITESSQTTITETSISEIVIDEHIFENIESVIKTDNSTEKNLYHNTTNGEQTTYSITTSKFIGLKYLEMSSLTTEDPLTQYANDLSTKIVTLIPNLSSTVNDEITESNLNNNIEKIISPTTNKMLATTDFEHASTLEMPLYNSSEESDKSSILGEGVTEDPSTTTDSGITFAKHTSEQYATSTTSLPQKSIETRSPSVRDRTDIPDDSENNNNLNVEPTEITTTFSSQMTTEDFSDFIKHIPLFNTQNISENPTSVSILSNASNELVIKLLPVINTTEIHSEDIKNKKGLTEDNSFITVISQSNETTAGKNLPQIEDKKEFIHKMEELLTAEIQPAKVRRKHKIPTEFECGRIIQTIPYNQRCDHKADCEDGTDELGCSCIDYLSTLDQKLLCDGVFDCSDGQDEIDCFVCPENMFLCKRSRVCLPVKYICDGTSQCTHNEDELDCFALSNGRELVYDIDERPLVNLEGFLTKRHQNNWNVICENILPIEEQEHTATHICRYLGFSSVNRYTVKYINIKDHIKNINTNERSRRNTKSPVKFTYRRVKNETALNIVIEDPELIKETCVPNVTKTCKSLYVYCDNSLFTTFEPPQMLLYDRAVGKKSQHWPWIAKVYLEGEYKCTGVLVDLSWVLVSHLCLWEFKPDNFVTVVVGSHRTLHSTTGAFEQHFIVDAKKDLYTSKATLLHLKDPAKYSNMVKPMVITASSHNIENRTLCIAIGQDNNNNTLEIYLEESNENCKLPYSCFKRKTKDNICLHGYTSNRQWAGIISCHTNHGWNPVASFVDSRGECGLENQILATDLENLKNDFKLHINDIHKFNRSINDHCEGTRCSRGRCVGLHQTCDGVNNCENGKDESERACEKKHRICKKDPFQRGCECLSSEMKCRNGKCVSKELFKDGHDDCGDATDEPGHTTCADYLARVMPSHLCDGILHCYDRSDEDPSFCKCYAKRTFKCKSGLGGIDQCVAPDTVCDGVRDCPNGEDERTCIGLHAPLGTPYGTGQVIIRSHGIWYSKCFHTHNHTKTELEAICRDLGFISGHAKEIRAMDVVHPHNSLMLDPFKEVALNNNTVIKMRNSREPLAKASFNSDLTDCFPVFIECH